MEVYVSDDIFGMGIKILMIEGERKIVVRGPMEIETMPMPSSTLHEPAQPSFTLPRQAVRPLMTALWNAGFRPEIFQDEAATIQAKNAHIALAETTLETILNKITGVK